jgi:wyosine [tRNA(Phe)-imidazoG37] synthetase (radical SAM superfamily)
MTDPTDNPPVLDAHTRHPRVYQTNRYVYPVLSRRSRGISVGVNLNPDKVCNFDCVYCQVDRRSAAETTFVETERLFSELEQTLELVTSGRLYDDPAFRTVPDPLRRLNDVAFSGDGEPTSFRNIDRIIARTAEIKRQRGLDPVKLILITNASLFHRPPVRAALATLDANRGEIWAKLDAGTEAYFRLIDRTTIPFRRVLDNIGEAARTRPLVIQSLFMRVNGDGPPDSEISAYCDRLNEVRAGGGAIDRVQVYTVARRPAEGFVAPLDPGEVDRIAGRVRDAVGVPVEAYYGPTS